MINTKETNLKKKRNEINGWMEKRKKENENKEKVTFLGEEKKRLIKC